MKVKSGWENKVPRTLFFVLLSVSLILMLPISSVHATGPIDICDAVASAGSSTVTCSSNLGFFVGEVVTVCVTVYMSSSSTTSITLTDTGSNSYVSQASDSVVYSTTFTFYADLFSTTINSNTVTLQWTSTFTNPANDHVPQIDVIILNPTSGGVTPEMDSTPTATAVSASASAGSSFTTSSSNAFVNGQYAVACQMSNVQSNTLVAGTYYTPYSPSPTPGQGQLELASNVLASPANYPFSGSGGLGSVAVDVGGIFSPPQQTITTTSYVPPTPTQLQYWYFPILFMGFYDMAFLTVGFLNRVSTKASIYLLLTGLLMGSVFSESVGLSALPLVVITLITYIIYIYRIRTSSR